MLNPFSSNSESYGDDEDDHYETIDDIQLKVAALKQQQEKNSEKSSMPKFEAEKDSKYSKTGDVQKVRPPRPKRPASLISSGTPTVAAVETQTSFDKVEGENAVIPETVISKTNQEMSSQEETKK